MIMMVPLAVDRLIQRPDNLNDQELHLSELQLQQRAQLDLTQPVLRATNRHQLPLHRDHLIIHQLLLPAISRQLHLRRAITQAPLKAHIQVPELLHPQMCHPNLTDPHNSSSQEALRHKLTRHIQLLELPKRHHENTCHQDAAVKRQNAHLRFL